MTTRFQRYAIYWTPPSTGGLAAFGQGWFGRQGETFGLPLELVARAIHSPARYGIHATLKAPFPLRRGVTISDLQQELDAFCGVRRGPVGGAFQLGEYQDYLCLLLSGYTTDVDWLAAECVTHFDRFRTSETERGDENFPDLSSEEETFLQCFGYPYILSHFGFHVSLAGPLKDQELDEVADALRPHLEPFMAEPVKIDCLSLLGEPDGGGVFELISRHRFR
ncbi:MAG: DUF1045 domain-containing protein [Rhodomicrobium sp.]